MKKNYTQTFIITPIIIFNSASAQAQNCDASVPVFPIDFTALTSDSIWVSPSVVRNGNCCNTLPPDRCVLFSVNAGSNVVALVFEICSGPLPPGSLYYQITCGPNVTYNDTTFISSAGMYNLTFCKPGNNVNSYCITGLILPTSINESVQSFNSNLSRDFQTGNYSLSLNLPSPSSLTLNIFSADGKKISEKNYSLQSGQQQIAFATEGLSQGIYFCRITGEGINKAFKFMKQ